MVYLRARYIDIQVTVTLVAARIRVAPIKQQTVPRFELCGALVTARLMSSVAADLGIDTTRLYARTDSSIVLGWLHSASKSSRSKVYVANRVNEIVSRVPAKQWRYVATDCNPADCASRGLLPKELVEKSLWWDGPLWLRQSPDQWPHRPDLTPSEELTDLRGTILVICSDFWNLWKRFSSFTKLQRVLVCCFRFYSKIRKTSDMLPKELTTAELQHCKERLICLSQKEFYSKEIELLNKGKSIPNSSHILSLQPLLDDSGLLCVGGRLQNSNVGIRHQVILSRKSHLVKLLVLQLHHDNHHAGPGTILSIMADSYHVIGIKRLVRNVNQNCVVCRRTYARTVCQQMGRLPSLRVNPAPPFYTVGVDLAGPFLCHRGNPRKPTTIKTYSCVFVCFTTRAVHLELLSDMSTQAFLAGFSRFCSRRGVPSVVFSNNGSNFVGADHEMKKAIQQMLSSSSIDYIMQYASTHSIDWRF